MLSTIKVALTGVTLFFCFSVGHAQQAQPLTNAVQLIGLTGLKENTKGNLTVINGTLRFVHAKGNADVTATSIENVVTGTDSQRVIGGTVGTLTQLAPFGSGRVLSLFRTKLDTLTIQYRDADGGLHAVIFTVPLGEAEMIKQKLIAEGAHTIVATQADSKSLRLVGRSRSHEVQLEKPGDFFCIARDLFCRLAVACGRTSASDAGVGNPGDDDPGGWDTASCRIPGVPL